MCEYRCKVKGNLDKHLRGRHKLKVMTVNKLWDKVMMTGQGYSRIVHRLTSFKTKGAIGMANDGDAETKECQEEADIDGNKTGGTSVREKLCTETEVPLQQRGYPQMEEGQEQADIGGGQKESVEKREYTHLGVPAGHRGIQTELSTGERKDRQIGLSTDHSEYVRMGVRSCQEDYTQEDMPHSGQSGYIRRDTPTGEESQFQEMVAPGQSVCDQTEVPTQQTEHTETYTPTPPVHLRYVQTRETSGPSGYNRASPLGHQSYTQTSGPSGYSRSSPLGHQSFTQTGETSGHSGYYQSSPLGHQSYTPRESSGQSGYYQSSPLGHQSYTPGETSGQSGYYQSSPLGNQSYTPTGETSVPSGYSLPPPRHERYTQLGEPMEQRGYTSMGAFMESRSYTRTETPVGDGEYIQMDSAGEGEIYSQEALPFNNEGQGVSDTRVHLPSRFRQDT